MRPRALLVVLCADLRNGVIAQHYLEGRTLSLNHMFLEPVHGTFGEAMAFAGKIKSRFLK